MDDTPNKRYPRRPAYLAVAFILLLVGYPLSIGPVLALLLWADAGQAAFDVLNTVYLPVQYAAEFIGAKETLLSYLNWWLAMIEV